MRIAFALPLELEDRLAPSAVRHGHELVARCSSASELASRIESLKPEVAVVAANERHLTDRLLAVADDAGVRVLALVAGEVERRHAASLGLLETADAASDWSELDGRLALAPPAALRPETRADSDEGEDDAPASPKLGTIIAVWGPAGAPGRTTVAITVAAELAAAGHSVALADVDTYSGSVAPALGLLDEAPGFAAACRLAGADSLNRGELERIGQR